MRMWMVDPRTMCRQHLLGEHVELHMIVGAHRRGKSLRWMIDRWLLWPRKVLERHEDLVAEMTRRGYRHNSPLDEEICRSITRTYQSPEAVISPDVSHRELARRCPRCRRRQAA